jgi:hypothetical protein
MGRSALATGKTGPIETNSYEAVGKPEDVVNFHLSANRRRHCIATAADFMPPVSGSVVYFVGDRFHDIKIGFAFDLRTRVKELQTGNPSPLLVYGYLPGGLLLERAFHRAFYVDRGIGEWFERSPRLVRTIQSIQAGIAKRHGIPLSVVAKPISGEDFDL